MCGILGHFGGNGGMRPDETWHHSLRHRGPDDSGVFEDPKTGLMLAHRRLAIIDLSPAGHQPMLSRNRRFVIVFNGEIYNYQDVRKQLIAEGVEPAGGSDTAVLVEAVGLWGVEAAVRRCFGMFAAAIYDIPGQMLWLIRDRIGEKPLYYGVSKGRFAFASELKAFRSLPGFDLELNRAVVDGFVRHGYVPGPESIYRNVWKLPPGAILSIRVSEKDVEPNWTTRNYWTHPLETNAPSNSSAAKVADGSAVVEQLDNILTTTIASQMVADVPLGAFLSGGIDSSTVVGLMQKLSSRPVKTFTIGFSEAEYNEATHARRIAQHLGTEHTELYVTPQEAWGCLTSLPRIWDEPFADVSQIPTLLVSKLARQHVTVCLSGDGGDEAFLGYGRYRQARSLWNAVRVIPRPARPTAKRLVQAVQPATWDAIIGSALLTGRNGGARHRYGDRVHKGADLLEATSLHELYLLLTSQFHLPDLVAGESAYGHQRWHEAVPERLQALEALSLIDFRTYLPDDILVKLDRAAMSVSLESRVPFLDCRVIEYVAGLPVEFKVRGGVTKWALREVLARYVPKPLFERPKQGFGVPIGQWLRGPLRDWAEALLHADRLARDGIFAPRLVQKLWAQHRTGERDWSFGLWNILMFQAWHDEARVK